MCVVLSFIKQSNKFFSLYIEDRLFCSANDSCPRRLAYLIFLYIDDGHLYHTYRNATDSCRRPTSPVTVCSYFVVHKLPACACRPRTKRAGATSSQAQKELARREAAENGAFVRLAQRTYANRSAHSTPPQPSELATNRDTSVTTTKQRRRQDKTAHA